jgi:rubrerythrin
MAAWEGLVAEGPPEMGLAALTGRETPAELIVRASAMEVGLKEFYQSVKGEVADAEVAGLLSRLAEVEVLHLARLEERYRLEAGGEGPPPLEERMEGMVEGGYHTRELVEKHRETWKTAAGVLEMALAIEAQALDLYLRHAQAMTGPETRGLFLEIADEEKAHLAGLGRMMNRKV